LIGHFIVVIVIIFVIILNNFSKIDGLAILGITVVGIIIYTSLFCCITSTVASTATAKVHNGIEYGDMQLIAEVYDVLKHAAGLTNDEIAQVMGIPVMPLLSDGLYCFIAIREFLIEVLCFRSYYNFIAYIISIVSCVTGIPSPLS